MLIGEKSNVTIAHNNMFSIPPGPSLTTPHTNSSTPLTGTDNNLLLLDRSGQGEVFALIKGRKFSQIEVDDRSVLHMYLNDF